MNSHRIVFLDIDGVLSNQRSWFREVDTENVGHLNSLIERTGAVAVISSTWRHLGLETVQARLTDAGFTGEIVGLTSNMRRHDLHTDRYIGPSRGAEIREWLRQPGDQPASIVILDDDDDMAELLPFLVQTDARVGLTAEDVERAAAILETQP